MKTGITMEDITMNEYLAMEHAKLIQYKESLTEKLWSLENDDDECEIYEVNLHEFPAICIREESDDFDWNNELLHSIFNET